MIEAQWVQMVVILLDQLSSLVKVLKNTFNKSHVRAIVPHYHTSFPVAQLVEHGASNAKIMGSIPRESKSW